MRSQNLEGVGVWVVTGGDVVGITVLLEELDVVSAVWAAGFWIVVVCDSVRTVSNVSKASMIVWRCWCVTLADWGHMVWAWCSMSVWIFLSSDKRFWADCSSMSSWCWSEDRAVVKVEWRFWMVVVWRSNCWFLVVLRRMIEVSKVANCPSLVCVVANVCELWISCLAW